MTSHDLTTEEGMLDWLRASNFQDGKEVATVERLSEGVTGFVYRAHLQGSERTSLIMKHAEDYAARSSSWKLDQSRMHFEYEGLQYLSIMEAEKYLRVRTPGVLFYDRTDFVLVMEDVGQLPSLKNWLQPEASCGLAEAIGQSLGRYLATVHNTSAARVDIKTRFNGNTTAKYLSSTLYFGRLPAAAAEFGHTDDYIRKAALVGEQDVNESDEVLTLGDFWTGNVLIDEKAPHEFQLYLVDLEFSKPGTAAFDIGQMAAEMYCLQVFRAKDVGASLLGGFLRWYRISRGADVDVAKVAIRFGAHLVVIVPRAWAHEGTPQRIREVVAEGVELIRLGWARDDLGLRRSIVGALVPEHNRAE